LQRAWTNRQTEVRSQSSAQGGIQGAQWHNKNLCPNELSMELSGAYPGRSRTFWRILGVMNMGFLNGARGNATWGSTPLLYFWKTNTVITRKDIRKKIMRKSY